MTRWIKIATTDQFEDTTSLELVVDDQIIALFHAEGEFYAIDGICAHQGGPLAAGELKHCTLTCPWHGWQYDIRTGKHLLSESIAQTRYDIKIEATDILIALE